MHHHWFIDDQRKLIVLKVGEAGPISKQDMGYFDAISYKVKQSVKNPEGKTENRPTFTFSVGKKKALITLQAHFALKKPQLCEKTTTFFTSFFGIITKITEGNTKTAAGNNMQASFEQIDQWN